MTLELLSESGKQAFIEVNETLMIFNDGETGISCSLSVDYESGTLSFLDECALDWENPQFYEEDDGEGIYGPGGELYLI